MPGPGGHGPGPGGPRGPMGGGAFFGNYRGANSYYGVGHPTGLFSGPPGGSGATDYNNGIANDVFTESHAFRKQMEKSVKNKTGILNGFAAFITRPMKDVNFKNKIDSITRDLDAGLIDQEEANYRKLKAHENYYNYLLKRKEITQEQYDSAMNQAEMACGFTHHNT